PGPMAHGLALSRKGGELREINGPPEEPGDESRDAYAENFSDRATISQGRQHPQILEIEWSCGFPSERAYQVSGELLCLPHSELRGRRAGPLILGVRDHGAIPERPDIGRTRHTHIGLPDETPALKRQAEILDQKMRRCPNC